MKERPILMNGAMVRATLAGTKTQTRRVVKPQPQMVTDRAIQPWDGDAAALLRLLEQTGKACPYGQPGDRLWVREAFSGPHIWERSDDDEVPAVPPSAWPKDSPIWYWADGEPTHGDWTKPRPSIHMPRWASRITLEITSVRVERLQEISEVDAAAEGMQFSTDHIGPWSGTGERWWDSARWAFKDLWLSINGPDSWTANTWVWVVEFKRVEKV